MSRIVFAAVAACLALATPATAEQVSFTRGGVTYVYTAADKDGVRVLEGTTSDGSRFRLVVRGDRVSGEVDGYRVAFTVPKSAKSATTVVAQR